mgnify:CR=1 FL=1
MGDMAKQSSSMTRPSAAGEKTDPQNNEWVRIPAACAFASLSRSTLYANFDTAGGAIRTASIRKRGATRGVRMVNVPSLREWLDSFAEQPAIAR